MAAKKNPLSFEDSLSRLDEIVRHLEKGDLPLGESLALYEEGTALIASCNRMLDEAFARNPSLEGLVFHRDWISIATGIL